MNVIELARNGDISVHWLWVIFSLFLISPLALLVAKKKNRISVSMILLCILPMINIYTLFFLLFFGKRSESN
ncbi:hypothetical protein SAMN06297229_1401 [Pseudidiomarina planktonica]|uniref:Phospholipase_D-nuclease N-terminal n=1 Tax=Pseudidiomarina planktonica TaxID=1323738 RepID=A0A1Y6ET75_9GAMM|nr:hypothetical protein CWI77_01765 [Pseudidiomarina planktonica]SMQ65948.1 hypothetical protein SAMN06297229_1401 [Pseudidiomarina planktonica]